MAVRVTDLAGILSRRSILKSRFARQHRIMRELESWRHLIEEDLYGDIWGDDPPDAAQRWTIIKPDIASVTDTVVAFLSGRRPKITAIPVDATQLNNVDKANENERVNMALFDTLDRDRPVSLLAESAEYAVHRGVLCGSQIWLDPDARGEKRYEPTPLMPNDPTAKPVVTKEGDFPLLPRLLDPLDCTYELGKNDQVIEFIHEYQATWDYLCDVFPDLEDKPEFKQYLSGQASGSSSNVTVIDYWDKKNNAIVINSQMYREPTPHNYHRIPFVVEIIRPRNVRTGANSTPFREGTPFCYYMRPSVKHASAADSMSRANLEKMTFATMALEGIDPNNSPYMPVNKESGENEFTMVVDLKGNQEQVIPTFGAERLSYLRPPDLVPGMQEFKANRARDAAMTSFPESILTGAQTADVSGYAYNQMKQAALARVEPPRMGLDRFWSRMLTLSNELIVDNWDLLPNQQLNLSLMGERGQAQAMKVDVDVFENVSSVRVEIKPEVPVNQEQEWGMIIQLHSMGLLSTLNAMDQIGIVQDASNEIDRIAFERFAQSDPATTAALAQRYMQKNGIQQLQQAAPPPPPPGPPGPGGNGAGGMAPISGAPPTPASATAMMPAPMPAMGQPNAGPMPQQLPPELAAALQGVR